MQEYVDVINGQLQRRDWGGIVRVVNIEAADHDMTGMRVTLTS